MILTKTVEVSIDEQTVERVRELLKKLPPLPWSACGCGKCGLVWGSSGECPTIVAKVIDDEESPLTGPSSAIAELVGLLGQRVLPALLEQNTEAKP